MKISGGMVSHYLVTVASYAGDNDGAPEDLSEYDKCIYSMKRQAERKDDLDYLRLAIDYLITHPEVDKLIYMGGFYDYDEEESDELLRYIRLKVWGEDFVANPAEVKKLELEDTMSTEWWQKREQQNQIESNFLLIYKSLSFSNCNHRLSQRSNLFLVLYFAALLHNQHRSQNPS